MAGQSVLELRRKLAQMFRCRNETNDRKSYKIKSDPFEDAAFANTPISDFGSLVDSLSTKSCHLHEPGQHADLLDETSVTIDNLTHDKPIVQIAEERAHEAVLLNRALILEDEWPSLLNMQLKHLTNTQARLLEAQSALIDKYARESSGIRPHLSHPKVENHHDGANQELNGKTWRMSEEQILEPCHRFTSEPNRLVEDKSPVLQEASALGTETQRAQSTVPLDQKVVTSSFIQDLRNSIWRKALTELSTRMIAHVGTSLMRPLCQLVVGGAEYARGMLKPGKKCQQGGSLLPQYHCQDHTLKFE